MSGLRDVWTAAAREALLDALGMAVRAFPNPGQEHPPAVHGARRALKRAASLARWFMPLMGAPAHAARDAANVARRAIARARDLDALPLALAKVKCADEIRAALMVVIARERAETFAGQAATVGPEIVAGLQAAAQAVASWDLSEASDEELLMALRATYRAAKRRGRSAFSTAHAEDLHRLRQGVVDLGHQLQALTPAWPAMIEAQTDQLLRLRATLGDYNDLTMLGEFALSRHELEASASQALTAALLSRRKPLERRARAQFERVFAERPGAFARRIARYLAHPLGKKPSVFRGSAI